MKILNEIRGQKFFKDSYNHVVLWQWPNAPLLGWLICKAISLLLKTGHLKHGFDALSMAFLFAWAYLEITQGVNIFRRLLGLVVIAGIVIGYFQ